MHLTTRVALLVVLGSALAAWGCGSSTPVAPDQSSVQYSQTDLVVGTGATAVTGSVATVTYTGWLYSDTAADHKGKTFGSGTFVFTVGDPNIIPGFSQGVTGMNVGGSRRLVLPPSLAYGTQGSSDGTIPPNAALVFEVTLNSLQ